jgi:hypothetical protein
MARFFAGSAHLYQRIVKADDTAAVISSPEGSLVLRLGMR